MENQIVRFICLVLILVPYGTAAMYENLRYFCVPFTNWTLMLTTATLLLSIWAGYDTFDFGKNSLHRHSRTNEGFGRAIKLQATLHLLYTLTIIMNFVVVCIYWTLLHKEQMTSEGQCDTNGRNCKNWGLATHLKIVHSIPALCCFTNAFISNIRLKFSFWKMISLICLVYGMFLYSFWRETGRQQYSFLDFNSGKHALLVLVAINVFATSFYIAFFHADQRVKNKLSSHYRISSVQYEFTNETEGV